MLSSLTTGLIMIIISICWTSIAALCVQLPGVHLQNAAMSVTAYSLGGGVTCWGWHLC